MCLNFFSVRTLHSTNGQAILHKIKKSPSHMQLQLSLNNGHLFPKEYLFIILFLSTWNAVFCACVCMCTHTCTFISLSSNLLLKSLRNLVECYLCWI